MKILLDECIPIGVLKFLKGKGLRANHINKLGLQGIKNGDLYRLAKNEYQVLITSDRHFRNPKRFPPTGTLSIFYLRVTPPSEEGMEKALNNFFSSSSLEEVKGKLVIVHKEHFEIR